MSQFSAQLPIYSSDHCIHNLFIAPVPKVRYPRSLTRWQKVVSCVCRVGGLRKHFSPASRWGLKNHIRHPVPPHSPRQSRTPDHKWENEDAHILIRGLSATWSKKMTWSKLPLLEIQVKHCEDSEPLVLWTDVSTKWQNHVQAILAKESQCDF